MSDTAGMTKPEVKNDQGFTKTEWDAINWEAGDSCLPRYMSMGLWNPRALRGGKYSRNQRRSFAKATKMGHGKK